MGRRFEIQQRPGRRLADIDIYVVDTCQTGSPTVEYQIDWDTKNRLALKDPASIVGKCLEVRVYGYKVPPAGRTVYATDYFGGGDASVH